MTLKYRCCLFDFDGTVAEVMPEAGKVKVMLTIFGRETPVELYAV